MLTLPEQLTLHTGAVFDVEQPAQGAVFDVFLVSAEQGRFVLKRASEPANVAALGAEAHVLSHLSEWRPIVAHPVARCFEDGEALFLFSYLEGTSLAQAIHAVDTDGQHAMIVSYAHMLHDIHNWKPELQAPNDWLTEMLDRALANTASGQEFDGFMQYGPFASVERSEFAPRLREWRRTLENDLVFCHGDYCLPNVLMEDGLATGVIDWSDGGYLDRRFDLATAALSIRHNLRDESFVRTFLTAYGYSEPVESLHLFEALYAMV